MINTFNKKIGYRAFAIFSLSVLLFFQLGTASALTDEQKKVIGSGIRYFNVDACSGSASPSIDNTVSGSTNGKAYMIGDSIAEGSQSELNSALSDKFKGGVTINAKASRSLTEGGSDLNGITVFKNDNSKWNDAQAIIIELGTNGGLSDGSINKILGMIQNKNTKVYWVNIGVVNSKRDGPPIDAKAINKTLDSNASGNYTVIDWASQVDQHPDYIDPNPSTGLGVHPIGDGKKAFVDTLSSAVSAFGGTPTAASSCCGSTTTFGDGSLPPSVPKPYNAIFTAAANKFKVPPAFLAALFYAGEHGSSWPDPPPPYGHGPVWADSHITGGNAPWPGGEHDGAAGPFQFEYPAWQDNGQDGNGDGKKDVEDLADAAFGSAHYLADLGANTTDQSKLHDAARRYNGSGAQAEAYANLVMAAFTKFGGVAQASPGGGDATLTETSDCSGSGAAAVGGLTNPFPGGWIPNRLDMGYDGDFKGHIVAPFDGTISYAGLMVGWKGSLGVIIKADKDIGLPTRSLYFIEGVKPTVNNGQHVTAGDQIADPAINPYNGSNGNIEWGVNQDGPVGRQTDTYAIALGGGNKCAPSQKSRKMVLDFYKWAKQSLHVHGNTNDPSCAGAP
jgi:hypothetical protein